MVKAAHRALWLMKLDSGEGKLPFSFHDAGGASLFPSQKDLHFLYVLKQIIVLPQSFACTIISWTQH